MKVITEKDAIIARNALLRKGNNLGACAIDMLISDHMQEIDTLTVSKLRHMCYAPRDGTLIEVWHKESPDPRESYFCDGFFIIDDSDVPEIELAGWLPKIIYNPELTG